MARSCLHNSPQVPPSPDPVRDDGCTRWHWPPALQVFYLPDPSEILHKAGFWSGMFAIIGAGVFVCSLMQQWAFGA